MSHYWPQDNEVSQTYGDITDAFRIPQESLASSFRSQEQTKSGISIWLKIALVLTGLVLLLDKLKL